MTETLIKIENLHKSFGKNEVLKGINLEIKKGEVVVIIGPSGSGKSTLLRSMNLLEEATKGKVIFEGVDITDKKNDLFAMREKMGMAPLHADLKSAPLHAHRSKLAPAQVFWYHKAHLLNHRNI